MIDSVVFEWIVAQSSGKFAACSSGKFNHFNASISRLSGPRNKVIA
jgi:hypothetical protein